MNTKFDNEFYKFFIKKENFEYGYDIHKNFKPVILDRLYKEFWKILKHTIADNFKRKFEINEYEEWGFYVCIKEWKYFKLFLGWEEDIHISYSLVIETKNHKKISKFIGANDLFSDLERIENSYYYRYDKDFDENFTELNSLIRLLPENRQELIDELIHYLEKFVSKYNKDVLILEKKLSAKYSK